MYRTRTKFNVSGYKYSFSISFGFRFGKITLPYTLSNGKVVPIRAWLFRVPFFQYIRYHHKGVVEY